jgi:LPXTG-site transpeptidase (sortase) family protein
MAAKKTQAIKRVRVTSQAIVTLLLLTTGCTPLEVLSAETQTLPTPVAWVTHAATTASIPAGRPLPPTPLASLAKIPIPKSDISKMADDLYGTRLIEQISVPALNVEAKVVPVGWQIQFGEELQNSKFEWDSPGADVGWVITSALPDEKGNVILYGHNNIYEKIFENLSNLAEGDKVFLQTGDQRWEYEVRNILLLPVIGASREQLKNYQQYLKPSQDARVTLISCWPPISNTHRVVVIAHRTSIP